jgi:hypothetical protein
MSENKTSDLPVSVCRNKQHRSIRLPRNLIRDTPQKGLPDDPLALAAHDDQGDSSLF